MDDPVWDEYRQLINDRLAHYMKQDADCPNRLREAMSYSLLAGGKRLRPLLVLMTCEACGGDIEAAMPAACAIEMVHTYSLIHDDLPSMDDDDLRRGRPTNHRQFDEATAILAGDALLTLAFQVIAEDTRPADVAAACCADLASAAGASGMVGGQVADLAAEKRFTSNLDAAGSRTNAEKSEDVNSHSEAFSDSPQTLEQLEAIHRRKTGRLLSSALTLGGRIAGADAETLDALNNYGKSVGLAFQIADDLLDISGDQAKMGKGVRKDADHGKLTYPGLLGLDQSRQRAQALIDDACRWISPLGESGQRLDALAQFVLERDH
ncbi:MAG: farnesyl-diphosphate synthase [Planctomycetaceae bacterium]|nr:farnesyl-diphosphate synthase [Planctomycetaceae bacterium]